MHSSGEKHICRNSKKNPFLTAHEIAASCNMLNKVSIYTVKRYLRNSGLFGRLATRKPLLSPQHMKNRKSWCAAYLKMDAEKWNSFVFSDECRFQIYANMTRVVRRPRNYRYCSRYVIKTVKYGGPSVMVWGAIKGDGSRVLVRCPKTLNSCAYQKVLNSGLFQLCGPLSVFVQDNAPCHKSRSTLNYLDNKQVYVLFNWPAQSPDINVIENLWSILKSKVQRRCPISEDDL